MADRAQNKKQGKRPKTDKESEYTEDKPASQATKPVEEFRVDPSMNYHGEPILPKDEPIDWDNLPMPSFNFPIPTKKGQTRKPKTTLAPRKNISKPKPTIKKDDYVYICDIKEFSDINLYLDELEEVRDIFGNNKLPERLVFRYKVGKEMTWPFQRILNEGYSTLVRVFSVMKKDSGFTRVAKTEILNKIAKIRQSWRGSDSLPRTLVIAKHGDTVHKEPH